MSFNASVIYTYKQNDEIFTPSNAIIPLIHYLPKGAVIWECAEKQSEDGNITKELRNAGFKVITTSIHNGIDFLTCDIPEEVTHIITNPPFSLKNKFLKRCYEIGKPFALLLPIQTLDTKQRFELYKQYGLQIILFDRRVSYIGSNGSPPFASCWISNKILPNEINYEVLPK